MSIADLHSWMWYACEQPERPPDACVVWHRYCALCLFKIQVQERRFPDDLHVAYLARDLERCNQ